MRLSPYVTHVSSCSNKVQYKKQFKGERIYSDSQFMTETSWQQELESVCHIASALKSRRAMDALIQLASLILYSLGPGFGKDLFWGESSYLT